MPTLTRMAVNRHRDSRCLGWQAVSKSSTVPTKLINSTNFVGNVKIMILTSLEKGYI